MISLNRIISTLPRGRFLCLIFCATILCAGSMQAPGQQARSGPNAATIAGTPPAGTSQLPKNTSISRAPRSANIHLHSAGVQQTAAPQGAAGTPAVASSARPRTSTAGKSALGRTRRWNYNNWSAQHLGLGTIEGWVRSNSAQPLKGIRVALRGPKGRIFANVAMRHVTFTDANGHFVMCNVKARSYRIFVRTVDKKHKTHVLTNLNPGGHLQLGITLSV